MLSIPMEFIIACVCDVRHFKIGRLENNNLFSLQAN